MFEFLDEELEEGEKTLFKRVVSMCFTAGEDKTANDRKKRAVDLIEKFARKQARLQGDQDAD